MYKIRVTSSGKDVGGIDIVLKGVRGDGDKYYWVDYSFYGSDELRTEVCGTITMDVNRDISVLKLLDLVVARIIDEEDINE